MGHMPAPNPAVFCIGGAGIDRKYHALGEISFSTSTPSRMVTHFGGNARNVAENLARLGENVALLSLVGDDSNGRSLLDHAARAGVDVRGCEVVRGRSTAEFAAVMTQDGDLVIGVADMRVIDGLNAGHIERYRQQIADAKAVFVDCNPSNEFLHSLIEHARSGAQLLAVEAVSESKVRKLPDDLHGVGILFLNENEAAMYLNDVERQTPAVERAAELQRRGARYVIMTLGDRGVLVAGETMQTQHPVQATQTDSTGASDAFIAGTLYRLIRGDALHDATRVGALLSALTIESSSTVAPDLSAHLLEASMYRLAASQEISLDKV